MSSCFNPCFVGEGIQTRWYKPARRQKSGVSILVLLEKGFRHPSRLSCAIMNILVSILVLLEKGFRHWPCWLYLKGTRMFQSLFCWRRDSDPEIRHCWPELTMGFNPCFVGEGIQTEHFGNLFEDLSRFQSLFCWRRDSDVQFDPVLHLTEIGFNPCFVGEGIQTWKNDSGKLFADKKFQSLFCWRRDSDYLEQRKIGYSHSGFNPCFVGEGIQTILPAFLFYIHASFNPCFVGEGIQTLQSSGHCRRAAHVSILVLLEKGFRHQSWPVYCGHNQRVSILVLLEKGFRLYLMKFAIYRNAQFQSLFCWRRDSDMTIQTNGTPTTKGFNPCFVGEGIQTIYFHFYNLHLYMGFNPCFVGEGIQTPEPARVYGVASMFQSLFCWRRDSDHSQKRSWLGWTDQFQSLFCWRRDSDSDVRFFPTHWHRGFNPCFVGEGIQTRHGLYYHQPTREVSILVLLEKGFRRLAVVWATVILSVSILVLLEKGFRLDIFPAVRDNSQEFQSLFCWRRDSDPARKISGIAGGFCFNPCFVGEGIQTRIFSEREIGQIIVSILVLLEKGFRRTAKNDQDFTGGCFNPCFVGEGIQTAP